MGIGDRDWGLGIGDWAQSPIPNPQSPIPNPHLGFLIIIHINFFNLIKKNKWIIQLKSQQYIKMEHIQKY